MSRRVLTIFAVLAVGCVCALLGFVRGTDSAVAVEDPRRPAFRAGEADAGSALSVGNAVPRDPRTIAAPEGLRPLRVHVVDLAGAAPGSWSVAVLRTPAAPDSISADPGPFGRLAIAEWHGAGSDAVEVPAEIRGGSGPLYLCARAYAGPDTGYVLSDVVPLSADMHGTLTLVVSAPPRLVVRIEGPRPAGDLRYEIAPTAFVSPADAPGARIATTSEGTASFVVAPDVAYRVRVTGPRPDDVVEATAAGIARSGRGHVVLRFPGGFADPLPPGYAELALAGRIDFEGDERPGLWASVDGGPPISIAVRADGTFELMHERASSVELHASGGDLEPRFDPEVSTHPFGTRDVVVRSLPVATTVPVRLRFVAAESGAPLSDAWVTFLVRDGERTRSRSLGGQSGTEVEVSLPALTGLEYFVCARDRRDERGVLFAPGAPEPGAVLERTIRLARGFRRDFRVVHCGLHTPVAGAEVALDALVVARSDVDGRLRIELDEWPGRLTIRAEGFDEGQWPPAWQTPLASTTMTVCPAD